MSDDLSDTGVGAWAVVKIPEKSHPLIEPTQVERELAANPLELVSIVTNDVEGFRVVQEILRGQWDHTTNVQKVCRTRRDFIREMNPKLVAAGRHPLSIGERLGRARANQGMAIIHIRDGFSPEKPKQMAREIYNIIVEDARFETILDRIVASDDPKPEYAA